MNNLINFSLNNNHKNIVYSPFKQIVKIIIINFLLVLSSCKTYEQGYEIGKQQGYQIGKEEGYNSGKEEGYNLGKQQGYNNGKQDGYQVGKKDGYEVGKQDGYEVGKQDGYELGKTDGYKLGISTNLIKYGIIGTLTGLFLTTCLILIVTKPLWIKEFMLRKRQMQIRFIIGKCPISLDESLYEQIISLSQHIDEINQEIGSYSSFTQVHQSIKSKLEDLLQKKIIKLAILIQEQNNSIAKIENVDMIEKSIKEHQQLLTSATGKVKEQLIELLEEESKKLSNLKNSIDRIKSYEFQLINYHNIFDNCLFSINNLRTRITEGELKGEEIETEISCLMNALSQFDLSTTA